MPPVRCLPYLAGGVLCTLVQFNARSKYYLSDTSVACSSIVFHFISGRTIPTVVLLLEDLRTVYQPVKLGVSITPQLRYRLHPAPLNRLRVLHPVTNLVTKSRLHIWQESLPLLALPAPRICIILRSDQTLTQNLIPPYPDKHPLKCPYYVRIYLNER